MTHRVFYVTLGVAVSVLVLRWLTHAIESLQPDHVAGSFVQSVREFLANVRVATAEREDELRDALGLDGRHDLVDVET